MQPNRADNRLDPTRDESTRDDTKRADNRTESTRNERINDPSGNRDTCISQPLTHSRILAYSVLLGNPAESAGRNKQGFFRTKTMVRKGAQMAILKKNGAWWLDIRPFRTNRVALRLDVATKAEATHLESSILIACRSADYSSLDAVSREAVVRMFRNQRLELPPGLRTPEPVRELTLMEAITSMLDSPGIADSKNRDRHEMSCAHLLEYFGPGCPVKTLWVPELREYQQARIKAGAAPATVNRELCSLSIVFRQLNEARVVDVNPCRMLKSLSTKSGQRQVYLSYPDVVRIASATPDWFRPLLWTAYYSGMRRGEILSLSRRRVDLESRMVRLSPMDTKEGKFKRVPIHHDLVPILRDALRVPYLGSEKLFVMHDRRGYRDIALETFKNPWPRACELLQLEDPWPRFHDLRHTWKTNARRSGVDGQIAEAILGHSDRTLSVTDRYGHISDEELVAAIDRMSFDHGSTIILTSACK